MRIQFRAWIGRRCYPDSCQTAKERWLHADMPASRWIKTGGLSRAESDVLDDEAERRAIELEKRMIERGERVPTTAEIRRDYEGVSQWSDERLLAAVLGKPAAAFAATQA